MCRVLRSAATACVFLPQEPACTAYVLRSAKKSLSLGKRTDSTDRADKPLPARLQRCCIRREKTRPPVKTNLRNLQNPRNLPSHPPATPQAASEKNSHHPKCTAKTAETAETAETPPGWHRGEGAGARLERGGRSGARPRWEEGIYRRGTARPYQPGIAHFDGVSPSRPPKRQRRGLAQPRALPWATLGRTVGAGDGEVAGAMGKKASRMSQAFLRPMSGLAALLYEPGVAEV